MTRVHAPSRLHFGLLNVPSAAPNPTERLFGGIGLMVSDPGVVVQVKSSPEWSATGPSAERALALAQRFTASLTPPCQQQFQIDVLSCPAEHTGLGVGTQLGLAVAKGIAVELGLGNLPAVELAPKVGRGARSGIGVHGFERGGLLFDSGKRPGEAISQQRSRRELPPDWRVLLICPRGVPRWHGDAERRAFASASPADKTRLGELFTLLETATDYGTFAESLYEYNRLAGAAFAEVQGGIYSSPEVTAIIERIRAVGVPATGQSSWGPTVFAITPNPEIAAELQRDLQSLQPELLLVTQAQYTGATVHIE